MNENETMVNIEELNGGGTTQVNGLESSPLYVADISGLSNEELLENYIYADVYLHPRNRAMAPAEVTVADCSMYDQLRNECLSRGYTEEQLAEEESNYIDTLLQSDIFMLRGKKLNMAMLSAMNDTEEYMLARYMSMTGAEREATPRFKSVLEGRTQGVTGTGRWDCAYRHGEPLVRGEDTGRVIEFHPSLIQHWESFMLGHEEDASLSDDGVERVPADLVAVMNEGQSTEVKIYRAQSSSGSVKMYCESNYLGNFEYNPTDWAIGYKEIPGTESENPDGSLSRIPVFRYVGPLEADWQHDDKSPAGMIGEYSAGDFFDAVGSNANYLANKIDFLGIIPDDDDGYTRAQQVRIPDGVRNLDYTFEGNDELQLVPAIPSSVTSMHCTFMDCDNMWEGSSNFKVYRGDHKEWNLPSGLEDMSYTFYDCDRFKDETIGKLPEGLLTIQGAFAGCPMVLENETWSNWTFNVEAWHDDTVEADWSESLYLRDEFSNPVDEDTSNTMKRNYEREDKERREFQYQFGQPENLAQQPEEVQERWADANAAEAVVRTEHVVDGDMTVRSIETLSYNAPDENELMALLQRGVIDVGSFALLKGVTGLVTDNKLAGWVVGIGGTAALRMTDILPRSIEPALNWVKQYLPESGQEMMDKFIDFIHIPGEEEYAAADDERMGRYRDVALEDSIGRSVWSSGVIYDSESMRAAMQVNGQAVADYGVLQRCGEDGRESATVVHNVLYDSVSKAEEVFERQMLLAEGQADTAKWEEQMRLYYWQLMYGLDGYNAGAQAGIDAAYKDDKDQTNRQNAEMGLAYVNCDYTDVVMQSLTKMDEKYHFMREEDWMRMNMLNIKGVSYIGPYVPGTYDQPNGVVYTDSVYGDDASMYDFSDEVLSSGSTEYSPSIEKSSAVEMTSRMQQSVSQPKPNGLSQHSANVRTSRVQQAEALLGSFMEQDDVSYQNM